jgi:hypothetical protein
MLRFPGKNKRQQDINFHTSKHLPAKSIILGIYNKASDRMFIRLFVPKLAFGFY